MLAQLSANETPSALVSVNGGVPGLPGFYIALRLSDSEPFSGFIGQDARIHPNFQPYQCLFHSPKEALGTLYSYARSRKLAVQIIQPWIHKGSEPQDWTKEDSRDRAV